MNTSEQQKQGMELMNTLVQKAWESATFKDQLVNNPEAAISEVVGREFKLPDNKKLVVEDQTDDSIVYLNIPAIPNLEDAQLTEEQLETLSGGAIPLLVGYGIVFLAGAAIGAWKAHSEK